MSPENFCLWLQGWFDLSNIHRHQKKQVAPIISDSQACLIRQELSVVINRIRQRNDEEPEDSTSLTSTYGR